jgi:integrase
VPIKTFRRKGSKIWSYRGTVAGRRLRGSTGTTDKVRAERIASDKETGEWKGHLDGPIAVLTFAKASILYRAAGKPTNRRQTKYLERVEDYWKDTLVKDITSGKVKQCALALYPDDSDATRNRQAVTVTRAVINHCAELELCAPLRVKGFRKTQGKIKKPVTLEWALTLSKYARPVIKALVLQMFVTAERFGEVHRTEWADYDFHQRTIRIRDTKTGKHRDAHMPNQLLVALANLARDKRPFWRSETTLRRYWDQDVATTADTVVGFERLTFHSCRHGFATSMLRKGIDPKTAATLGGWNDVALFMETYAHAIQDATLTEAIIDTDLTPPGTRPQQKQRGRRK